MTLRTTAGLAPLRRIDGLDPEQMRNLVGEEEAQALDQLQQMMRQLEEDGYIRHNGERLELTSRGIRRIGQKVLEDIFAKLKRDAFGHHAAGAWLWR